MDHNMERAAFAASGRVQGVGFRAWVSRRAAALHLRGVVRNQPDGSVLVVAEGRTEDLERLEALLREGPVLARVDRLERLPAPDDNLPSDFRIAG